MTTSFFDRLERVDGCLVWVKGKFASGYGCVWWEGKSQRAHRVAWMLANGPIPDGLDVLHRCDNPPCCDLAHLFLGTPAENAADKVARGRHHAYKITHCPQGHEYSEENTYQYHGNRLCRTCRRDRDRSSRAVR